MQILLDTCVLYLPSRAAREGTSSLPRAGAVLRPPRPALPLGFPARRPLPLPTWLHESLAWFRYQGHVPIWDLGLPTCPCNSGYPALPLSITTGPRPLSFSLRKRRTAHLPSRLLALLPQGWPCPMHVCGPARVHRSPSCSRPHTPQATHATNRVRCLHTHTYTYTYIHIHMSRTNTFTYIHVHTHAYVIYLQPCARPWIPRVPSGDLIRLAQRRGEPPSPWSAGRLGRVVA